MSIFGIMFAMGLKTADVLNYPIWFAMMRYRFSMVLNGFKFPIIPRFI